MRHFWTSASLILLHRSATTHGKQRTLDHSSRCGDWVFFLFKIVLGFISCIVLRCGKSFNGLVCTGICPRKCNAKSNARTEQRFDFEKKWLTRMYDRKAGTSSQSFPIVPRTRFKPSIWIFLRRRRRRISFRGSSTVRCPVSTLISIEVIHDRETAKKKINCVKFKHVSKKSSTGICCERIFYKSVDACCRDVVEVVSVHDVTEPRTDVSVSSEHDVCCRSKIPKLFLD